MSAREQLADVIEDAIDSVHDVDVTHRDYALAAADAVLGMIKPLEWRKDSPCAANNHTYQAHAPWGTYGVHIRGGRHQAWLEAHEKPYELRLGGGYVGSALEAQAAANEHHRAQILAALGINKEPKS